MRKHLEIVRRNNYNYYNAKRQNCEIKTHHYKVDLNCDKKPLNMRNTNNYKKTSHKESLISRRRNLILTWKCLLITWKGNCDKVMTSQCGSAHIVMTLALSFPPRLLSLFLSGFYFSEFNGNIFSRLFFQTVLQFLTFSSDIIQKSRLLCCDWSVCDFLRGHKKSRRSLK